VWLDCSFLPSFRSETDRSSSFVEMKADATSLVPGTIVLVDGGNCLLVRRNIAPNSFAVDEGEKLSPFPLIRIPPSPSLPCQASSARQRCCRYWRSPRTWRRGGIRSHWF
jgi:hypothetical protein